MSKKPGVKPVMPGRDFSAIRLHDIRGVRMTVFQCTRCGKQRGSQREIINHVHSVHRR